MCLTLPLSSFNTQHLSFRIALLLLLSSSW
jgi:hypothetical protein